MSTGVAIFGVGGCGREAGWIAETCGLTVVCYIDDHAERTEVAGVPVMALEHFATRYAGLEVVVGLGNPGARERTVERLAAKHIAIGGLVHPQTTLSGRIQRGPGLVISAGCILTTDITLGAHVQINTACTVAHDCRLGDFATLAPGVHLSGWVVVERGAYVGTGAVVLQGTEAAPLVIGAGAMIGAGAVVTKSVTAGTTVVGIPARARATAEA